jgi:hypothetical protein
MAVRHIKRLQEAVAGAGFQVSHTTGFLIYLLYSLTLCIWLCLQIAENATEGLDQITAAVALSDNDKRAVTTVNYSMLKKCLETRNLQEVHDLLEDIGLSRAD